MTTDTLEHRNRVIYVGLRRMTTDRNLIIDGFSYWTKTHANEALEVESVVTSLVDYLGLGSGEKKALMVAMHAASNKITEDLPEVPQALLDRITDNGKSSKAVEIEVDNAEEVRKSSPPHCVVTSQYFQSLMQSLNKHDNGAFTELKSIIRDEGVEDTSDTFVKVVKDWAANGLAGLELPDSMTEKDCIQASHQIYLLLTEIIGPMDADALVNESFDRVKGIDEAIRFSPRLLL